MPSQLDPPQDAPRTAATDENSIAPPPAAPESLPGEASSESLRSETARANGAKSHGPVTPEGLARSSRNALRHGLSAKSVVLPAESQEQFQILLDAYIQQFQPHTDVELELVEVMAAARWRLRRTFSIETNVLSTELVRREDDIDWEFQNMTDDDRLAWVYQKLADRGQTLSLLVRYEGALSRSYDKAFKQLLLLQGTRNRLRQNEPKPLPDPAAPDAAGSPFPLRAKIEVPPE